VTALGAGRADDLDLAGVARYEGLALRLRGGMGERPGDRRFPGHPEASGIELEAYAPYTAGDDLRHLDWNAFGRLDALLVRRFTAEREVVVHVLVDASASMGAPPRDHKLATAVELALGLGYVALASNDALRIGFLAGEGAARQSPLYRRRGSAGKLAEFLKAAAAIGRVDLGGALEAYARRHHQAGAAIVVSDFMQEPGGIEVGVQALRARRYDVILLHVLGASEVDPGLDFEQGILVDAESGERHPMALTQATLARYRALLDAHLAALRAIAERAGASYAILTTGTPVHAFVTTELARIGLVGRR
jgi:uncharacterized protein (DUF58 family)